MKRSHAVLLGSMGVMALVAANCGDDVEVAQSPQLAFLGDSSSAAAACDPPPTAGTRAGFVQWASRLDYREVDSTHARLHGFVVPSGDTLRYEITSPARMESDVRRGCVIGRIISSYADSAFGFADGVTYVWADSSSPDGVQLVPDDGTSSMISYNLVTVDDPDASEPVAPAGTPTKHICGECTKSDWCVYPSDTLRVIEQVPPNILP
ncbi:MAG TPA: hypothetical protein VJ650_02335 [Gemmatimonadaceae bacterium]|nr:hypothetical protein [Gemmatimonadaceae bacterium]